MPLNKGDSTSNAARKLPDPDICRARKGHGEMFDCLVKNPWECAYALGFGSAFYCRHPQREQIAAKTNRPA